MKKKTLIWLIVLAVIAIVIVIAVVNANKKVLKIDTATVENGSIEVVVMATGYVQPVDKVDVGTQVSGIIERIYVDYNSVVKRGELLAELERLTLEERVTQNKAALESSISDSVYAKQNYDRTKLLYDAKAATEVSMEEAVNRMAAAATSTTNARANLRQAEVDLSYAYITSPVDGVILDRAVNEGQTVAASFNTPTLFTIARDLTRMQVEADIDEADIGNVKVDQRVTFTVDAFPDDTFEGLVNQIRLQPTVTNNVVTYTVIIEAPNPDQKLLPGMTASINIITDTATGLLVPSGAFNFHATPEILEWTETPANVASAQTEPGKRQIWVLKNGQLEPRNVTTGINDGINVIANSAIAAGEEVVLSVSYEKNSSGSSRQNASLMLSGPGGGGPPR